MAAEAALTAYQADVYRDVLALADSALSGDLEARTAILSAWQGRDAVPLLFAAVGRLLGLAAEHGDVRAWIEAERAGTYVP